MRNSMVFEGVIAILFIALCFLMYVAIVGSTAITNNLDTMANGQFQNLQIGNDGALYAFMGDTGNTIYALDSNGSIKWKTEVSEQWRVENPFNIPEDIHDDGDWYQYATDINPVFSTDNGTMYLYLRENGATPWSHYPSEDTENGTSLYYDYNASPLKEDITAISQNGEILWNTPIGTDNSVYHDVSITAQNGRVYVFDDYNVIVLDDNGTTLFTIQNVSDPPAIDTEGCVYVVSSMSPSWVSDIWPTTGYLMPSNTLRAYYPNGTLWWQENVSAPAWRQGSGTLPVYENNTLYVPMQSGILALYLNGSAKLQKIYDSMVESSLLAPIDSNGNVYLQYSWLHGTPYLDVINAEGQDVINRSMYDDNWSGQTYLEDYLYTTGSIYDGNLYYANYTFNGFNLSGFYDDVGFSSASSSNLEGLTTDNKTLWQSGDIRINSVDMLNDTMLWSSNIPLSGTSTVTLDKDNAAKYVPPGIASWFTEEPTMNYVNNETNMSYAPADIELCTQINILPGQNIIYVSLWSCFINEPGIYPKSNCTYASALYAFSKNGTLIWEKPTDYYVTKMVANNSTIYFNTADGKFNIASINSVAGGVAIIALVLVFLRFFCIGAVARAKASLNKNVKRNQIYDYIVKNPGLTIYEIARGTNINMGTARYHVFILGLNHKIASCKADSKYVRYFTNSNSYSQDEQLVLSFMRRGSIGRVLRLLLDNPNMSSAEIAKELNVQESAVCRCIRELSEKGIITRDLDKKCFIDESKREYINTAIKRIYGE